MSKTKTERDLNTLHSLITKAFLDILKSGEAKASELNVIRQFLKDNGIDMANIKGTDLNDLAMSFKDLPFPTEHDMNEWKQ